MSRNKVHTTIDGVVIGFGSYDSDNYIEIDNFEEALSAFRDNKSIKVVDGQLVISESRAEKLRQVRQVRDDLLAQSDILKLKLDDAEDISGELDYVARQKIAIYRQALRDITLQDPFSVTWPVLETNDE